MTTCKLCTGAFCMITHAFTPQCYASTTRPVPVAGADFVKNINATITQGGLLWKYVNVLELRWQRSTYIKNAVYASFHSGLTWVFNLLHITFFCWAFTAHTVQVNSFITYGVRIITEQLKSTPAEIWYVDLEPLGCCHLDNNRNNWVWASGKHTSGSGTAG